LRCKALIAAITDDSPAELHQVAMRGGQLALDAFSVAPAAALRACNARLATREIRLVQLEGRPYYWCVEAPERTLLVSATDGGVPGRTLIYVDPHSAAPVLAYDASGRWYRWLFHGLHSLDFAWLYRARPLWDIVVLTLMGGGLLLSATGVWIGVKWLARQARAGERRRRAERARSAPAP
jgi:hypothetical protein